MADASEVHSQPAPGRPSAIDRVVHSLMAYEPETIILFGSAARGDTDEYSDLDLIVIKQSNKRFVERLVEVTAYLPRDTAVDVLVYTPQEFQAMQEEGNPFIEQALSDGIVLYDKAGEGINGVPITLPSGTRESYFMKKPLETARRWLAQAEHNLIMTRSLLDNGFWAGTCFQAEQTAQLVLKAYLFLQGRRFVNVHSIPTLAQECSQYDAAFLPIIEHGVVLDRYYLSTRYPDTLPAPAIPYQSFTEQEAQQALGYVTEMVTLVKTRIAGQDTEVE
jgi:HEPN domain-containing protein/predicted nucleotidyltransferase